MADNFDRALAVILHHEGGYVNNPRDPGGRTNLGVTQNTLEAWLKRAVTEKEMRALTPHDVGPIYRKNYWDKCRCDDLPSGVDLCVFDFAVNAGPSRAARYLQKDVGTAQDGVIGPATIQKVKDAAPAVHIIKSYQEARRGYYKQLNTFPTFGKGWLRRVAEVETEALEWANESS